MSYMVNYFQLKKLKNWTPPTYNGIYLSKLRTVNGRIHHFLIVHLLEPPQVLLVKLCLVWYPLGNDLRSLQVFFVHIPFEHVHKLSKVMPSYLRLILLYHFRMDVRNCWPPIAWIRSSILYH